MAEDYRSAKLISSSSNINAGRKNKWRIWTNEHIKRRSTKQILIKSKCKNVDGSSSINNLLACAWMLFCVFKYDFMTTSKSNNFSVDIQEQRFPLKNDMQLYSMIYGKEESGWVGTEKHCSTVISQTAVRWENTPRPFPKPHPLGLSSSWCIPHSNISPPLCSLSITVGDTSAKTVNFP